MPSGNQIETSSPTLCQSFHSLDAAGTGGFEGLVVDLLSELSGLHFHLSQAGQQSGRDAKTSSKASVVAAVETKRYKKTTSLDARELIAELHQAITSEPQLDVWILAASRNVPDQIVSDLETIAAPRGIAILVLDSLADGNGSLDVLAATFPDVVGRYFPSESSQVWNGLLTEIRARPGSAGRIAELKKRITAPDTGWPSWRESVNAGWLELMKDADSARARFGQPLAILAPDSRAVPRTEVSQKLDQWWEQHRSNILFVIGEEGDGKTWLTAEWISSRLAASTQNLPPVIFVPSREAGAYSNFEELLEKRLRPNLDRDVASKKLERLKESAESTSDDPLAVVILDGLNEREKPEYWRKLLEQRSGTSTGQRIALICTVRESYWKSNFAPHKFLGAQTLQVPSFSDEEVRQALQMRGRSIEDFPADIQPLLRKPRYLDLAVQHSETMTESGDITVARLIFEDWRDRHSRRDTALSPDGFNDLLKQLAAGYREGKEQFVTGEIRDMLPEADESDRIIRELSTGGVLNKSGGKLKVDATRLPQGLGLLLADRLSEVGGTEIELREELARWLEPNLGMDISSATLEYGFIYAISAGYSSEVIKVLLFSWINSQNPRATNGQTIEDAIVAYLPLAFGLYVEVAEKIWSSREDNPWAQEVFLRAFSLWANRSDAIRLALVPVLERWAGMLPLYGSPVMRPQRNKKDEVSASVKAAFGDVGVGSACTVGTYTLHTIDDDLWLRLGHTALSIISQMANRQPLVRALILALLVDSVSEGGSHQNDLNWIIRSSVPSLDTPLMNIATELIGVGTRLAHIAASRLLRGVGTEPAWALRSTLNLDQLFPTPQWIHAALENPFLDSSGQVGIAQVEAYVQREDFNPFAFVRSTSELMADPALTLPANLASRIDANLQDRKREKIWSTMSRNEEDVFFEDTELVFSRASPQLLATFLREVVQTVPQRSTDGLMSLSHRLDEYDLLLDNATRQLLYDEIQRKDEMRVVEADPFLFIECRFFASALPLWRGAAQLDHFRARSPKAFDWVEFSHFFEGPVQSPITTPTINHDWFRTVHYLAEVRSPSLTPTQGEIAFNHPESLVRGGFFHYIYACDLGTTLPNSFATWRWEVDQHLLEQTYGSLLKIQQHATNGVGEWIDTIDPHHRAWALEAAGATTADWLRYATWIDHNLEIMAGLPPELGPRRTVRGTNDPDTKLPDFVAADHETSNTIHFVAPESVWGGRFSEWPPKLFPSPEEQRETAMASNDQIRAQGKSQSEAGNYWIHRSFPRRGLDLILDADPTAAERWIRASEETPRLLSMAQAFYVSLLAVLVKRPECHEEAVKLYRSLKLSSRFTRYVDRKTELEFIDLDLFAASRSIEMEKLWKSNYDACNTNQELLEIALLARCSELKDSNDWLKEHADAMLSSESPLERAKAIMMQGFLEHNLPSSWPADTIVVERDVWWLEEVHVEATKHARKEAIARFWFQRFCTNEGPVEAWAAYRLFLEAADRRCFAWCTKDLDDLKAHAAKRAFFDINFLNLSRKIKDNEKKLKETFVGCKVRENLFPWMTIT